MSAFERGAAALERPGDKARQKADSGHGWYAVLARTGLVAKGLSFGLVGALAVKLALGDGGQATSRQGALKQLAQQSFGKVALIALAFGFAAYALWRFVQAFAERAEGDEGAAKVWLKRTRLHRARPHLRGVDLLDRSHPLRLGRRPVADRQGAPFDRDGASVGPVAAISSAQRGSSSSASASGTSTAASRASSRTSGASAACRRP